MPTSKRTTTPPAPDLERLHDTIVTCARCPRLRAYCTRIAGERRAAYRHDTYWARPVVGFGDPHARIALVGLAPAAHGANRTGRMFTGDGAGGSGDFLMAALHAIGLANQPTSRLRDDGLVLKDVWITAAVRCAPPDNKPTPDEISNCAAHLRDELAALPRIAVYVALGRLAFDACWRLLRGHEGARTRPRFSHGVVYRPAVGPVLIGSYHPSRQNTHTGRLTPTMLRDVLGLAKGTGSPTSSSGDERAWNGRRRPQRPP